MDYGRSDLVEVLERVDDLHDDGAALLLRHELVLLQVEVQVVALAVLQHRAEPAQAQPVVFETYRTSDSKRFNSFGLRKKDSRVSVE